MSDEALAWAEQQASLPPSPPIPAERQAAMEEHLSRAPLSSGAWEVQFLAAFSFKAGRLYRLPG